MDLRGPSLYYQKMYNDIHVDEKWFYLIKEGRKFILTWDEEEAYITQQDKSYVRWHVQDTYLSSNVCLMERLIFGQMDT